MIVSTAALKRWKTISKSCSASMTPSSSTTILYLLRGQEATEREDRQRTKAKLLWLTILADNLLPVYACKGQTSRDHEETRDITLPAAEVAVVSFLGERFNSHGFSPHTEICEYRYLSRCIFVVLS